MNMMEKCAYSDDRVRSDKSIAVETITDGMSDGRQLLLNAIESLQKARTDLRFALKALDKPFRDENKWVAFWYHRDMNFGARKFYRNIEKCERLMDYAIEFLRDIYDGSRHPDDFDVVKAVMQLRNVFYEIDENPEKIE